MKKIYPLGFSAILYIVFSIFCISFVCFTIPCLFAFGSENDVRVVLPVFAFLDLLMLVFVYLLLSSIRIIVKIKDNILEVTGQPIRNKNKIQHNFSLEIKKIKRIYLNSDSYNSNGKEFLSLNPRHMYQLFINFEMYDGKKYKLWAKHFSEKQIKYLLNLINN